MRRNIFLLFIFLSASAAGQKAVDPSKLPLAPYKPSIFGVNRENKISIDSVFSYGLRVIVADKIFKVIQFDVVYDCHSRSIFDFNVKRYLGDKVDPRDEYLRKRILA